MVLDWPKCSFIFFCKRLQQRLRGGAQLCPALCSPLDCSPPGSSAHGIFQIRILEQGAISYSRGSSQPKDRTHAQTKETKKTNSFFVFLFLYQTVELPCTQVLSTCAPTGATRSFPKLFLWPLPTCPSLYQVRPSSLTFQFRCHSSWECSWNPTTKVIFLPVCPHDAVLSLSQQLS